ncbi:MAG: octanoyltransferase [Marinomonas sp.]|jgi:lipoyl(octanoyl) transferase|uniref:lipoyl(octanoyl) transferase LipB n=1 Tax=Marinomonas communis TaxID=28254 RepID=UPI000C58D5B9|nr:lipoyl(octanoyl) transferase LipB [Marinomonas communis]MAF15000.1 octanoyltransferase [Marinomonas sp.]MEC8082481.1 lipoyl(octanoyl) transferase LipB [Pseudomonadota bacterium]MCC4274836.1 lipoyl(octanoyl) transferase LipB [Marinomonas communis]RUM48531.1 MAG: octanoyltransferase [Marinomonas sp.]RUM56362.1 MAG: octanoyltransferase [Marinomonas sp.]
MPNAILCRDLGVVPYESTWEEMKQFTQTRTKQDQDQIWLLEHPSIFTQGQAGKAEHLLDAGDIPVIQADRGGQVTYHGPGQLIAYIMIDLKRAGIGVRDLVTLIEQSIVDVLSQNGIESYPKPDAPGVYVNEMKVSSLGLRVRRGCSFHGVALNVDMDLGPFLRINPCGYQGLQMIDMKRLQPETSMAQVKVQLANILAERLGYSHPIIQQG